jgi:DNA-binding Lrp family transcriptional regulator
MRELDETDIRILALLAEDARSSFRAIGDEVDLSGPAVSDRVQRLHEAGIIERFTIDVNREHLRSGTPILVRFAPPGEALAQLRERLREAEGIEHVFVTAEGVVHAFGHAAGPRVRPWIEDLVPDALELAYEVTLVDEAEWTPSFEGAEFAIRCAECGNTVDAEGETSRIEGTVHHFCCASCQARFEDTYQRLTEGA